MMYVPCMLCFFNNEVLVLTLIQNDLLAGSHVNCARYRRCMLFAYAGLFEATESGYASCCVHDCMLFLK